MIPKYKNNDIVGNLRILKIMPVRKDLKNRRRLYNCICKCGNLVNRDSHYLRISKLLSCGCNDERKEKDRENAIMKRLYHFKIKSSAVRNRIRLISNLTFPQFKDLIKKPCFYCGIAYSLESKDIIRGKIASNSIIKFNGIDRVDSDKGYILDNCVPCCSTCNMGKRLLNKKDFLLWIKRVYEFNNLSLL